MSWSFGQIARMSFRSRIEASLDQAASYLYEELGRDPLAFVTSADALDLRDGFLRHLNRNGQDRDFQEDVRKLTRLSHQLQLVRSWLSGFVAMAQDKNQQEQWPQALEEAAALLVIDRKLTRRDNRAKTHAQIAGLLSQHKKIANGTLDVRLDEFLSRLEGFRRHQVPGFRDYQKMRHELLERERYRLRISEYMPRVMSSFVRNQLIDQVYLPMIGERARNFFVATGPEIRSVVETARGSFTC